MDKFGKDDVQQLVSLADDPNVAQKWLDAVFEDDKKAMAAQSSFRFFSYLCYLKDKELIEDDEFGLFEDALIRMLFNEKVQEYMRRTMNHLGDDNVVHPFQNLLDYATRHHIDIYAVKSDLVKDGCAASDVIDNPTDRNIIETNNARLPLTVEELSQYPVAVIRINRLYRPNMDPRELYAVTRGWWRVNIDIANKAKYVLSVAEGHVKEVYVRKGEWHKYEAIGETENDGTYGRYRFDGNPVKEDSIRRLYLGRSIQGVFKQGDAYPVRYFGINV